MSDGIDDKLVQEALQRFARTSDGFVFYIGLQKLLMGIPADVDGGALRENLGRRKFASELMAVMAEAIKETGSDPTKRPVVFTLSGARAVADTGTRGARRRVPLTVPGSSS